MRRWSAEVAVGNAHLTNLLGLLDGLEVTEVDGSPAITFVSWDNVDTPEEIFDLAERAVENAVLGASVMSNSPVTARIGGVVWEQTGNGEMRRHLRAITGTADIFLDPIRGGNKRPFGDRMSELVHKYPKAAPALHVFATCGSDVRAMWLAFEVVKQLAGGEKALVDRGWTDNSRLNQFMGTANLLYRHHPMNKPRRKSSKPMTPNACRAYVRDLVERLLDSEVPA